MRELKFRVYIPDHDKFCYFSLGDFDYSDRYLRQHQYPVQQYTGLKDKNGKEIHEGDIVEAIHFVFDFKYKDNKRPENYSGTIRWHHSYWAIGDYKLFVMEDDSLNVIGNIFENPELLKS